MGPGAPAASTRAHPGTGGGEPAWTRERRVVYRALSASVQAQRPASLRILT